MLMYCIVFGVLLGVASSGAYRKTPYYEPAVRQGFVGGDDGVGVDAREPGVQVPQRKRFLFLPLSWVRLAPVEREPSVVEITLGADDEDEVLRRVLAKKLTLSEQFTVLKILFTRLNRDDRKLLVSLLQGGATQEEALEVFFILRERLNEDELVLTLSLIKKYRSEIEDVLK